MANFLDDIKAFDGDREAEIYLRCKRLVKRILEEKERLLMRFISEGKNTKLLEFEIARIKYALGETDKYPDARMYFSVDNVYWK
jgi:hypothetical protein